MKPPPTLKQAMTPFPYSVEPGAPLAEARRMMDRHKVRHLPVTEDGKCIAVVSIRDLFADAKAALEESIKETEAFVFGDRYGG